MNEHKLFNKIVGSAEFMIGSREWGCNTNKSDYDLVYYYNKAQKVVEYIRSKNIDVFTADYPDHILKNQSNIKFTLDGKVINILTWETKEEIELIKIANEYVKNLPDEVEHKEHKWIRCNFFQDIVKHLFSRRYRTPIVYNDDEIPF